MSTSLSKVVGGRSGGSRPVHAVSPALHVAPETGTAYALVLVAVAIVDRDGQRRFDTGSHWRDLARSQGLEALVRRTERIAREAWLNLLGLVHDMPDARDAHAFVELIRTMDPAELRRVEPRGGPAP